MSPKAIEDAMKEEGAAPDIEADVVLPADEAEAAAADACPARKEPLPRKNPLFRTKRRSPTK